MQILRLTLVNPCYNHYAVSVNMPQSRSNARAGKPMICPITDIGGSIYAIRAFATPIFVASATPIFVASATPYFRISATQTAATPKILF